jgi:integrase
VRGSAIEAYKAMRLATRTRRKAFVQPASLNRELAALKRAFKLGITQERIASAPVISLLAEHNARQGFVEPGTFAAIVAHLPAPLDDLARFAYTVGWPVGEVKSLEWSDVDLTNRSVTLRREESKNGEPRRIILTGDLLTLMERRWAARPTTRPTAARPSAPSCSTTRVSGSSTFASDGPRPVTPLTSPACSSMTFGEAPSGTWTRLVCRSRWP